MRKSYFKIRCDQASMWNIAVNTRIQIQDIQTLLCGMLCHSNLHMLQIQSGGRRKEYVVYLLFK